MAAAHIGFLTRREIAARLGISVQRVAQLVQRGRIRPALTVGAIRMELFTEADVEAEHQRRRESRSRSAA